MKSHRMGENVCNYISDKGLSTVNGKKENLIRKCIKGRNKYLTKEDIQMANKHRKRCFT